MTEIDETELLAKTCFDRQEWERHEDRPSHEPELWGDIDETAKDYWREFVKPLLPALRAAERRGRAMGMREAAEIAYLQCLKSGNVKRRTETLGLGRETYNTEYASECRAAILAAASKLDSTD